MERLKFTMSKIPMGKKVIPIPLTIHFTNAWIGEWVGGLGGGRLRGNSGAGKKGQELGQGRG